MPIKVDKYMSNEDYHADKAISKSGLDKIHKSIAHFMMPPSPATPALVLGSGFHAASLQRDVFEATFIVEPDMDRRTKEGKEKYKAFKEKAEGKTILTQIQYDTISNMVDALNNFPKTAPLFDQGTPEVSLFWDELDLPCKARPDWVLNNHNGLFLVDLKSTLDASPEAFARSVLKYRYHVQCAWYSRAAEVCYGEKPQDFIFLAVENHPPYNVAAYSLGLASRDEGWMIASADLHKYKSWLSEPEEEPLGYSEAIVEIDIPNWGFTQI